MAISMRRGPPRQIHTNKQKSVKRLQNAYEASVSAEQESDSEIDQSEFTRGLKNGEDEEIDSDDAFDSGDEAKYDSFAFSGSAKNRPASARSIVKNAHAVDDTEINLSETETGRMDNNSDSEESASDFEDDDAEDLMDLSEMLATDEKRHNRQVPSQEVAESSDVDSDADSISDNEQSNSRDSAGSKAHGNVLHDFVRAMDGKRKHDQAFKPEYTTSKQPPAMQNEEDTPVASQKLRLEDLLEPLDRQQVKSLSKTSTLAAPLAKPLQDRVNRSAAYETVKDEISKWQPAVKAMRESRVLKFPQAQSKSQVSSNNSLAATLSSQNILEREIDDILQQSNLRNEKDVSAFEDLAMAHLSVEDVKRRRAELALMRDLLFRQERKAKRQAKIKSRSYRKVHRREREKLEALLNEGNDDTEDATQKRLEQRARERMDLRHKNTSKWAQKMLSRADHGEGSRAAITEQLQRGEDLARKMQGEKQNEQNDSASEDETSDSPQENLPQKGVFAMKFMREAMEKPVESFGEEDDLEDDNTDARENSGRRSFAPAKPGRAATEPFPQIEFRANGQEIVKTATIKHDQAVDPIEETANPWLSITKPATSKSLALRADSDQTTKFAAKLSKSKSRNAQHAGKLPALDFSPNHILPLRARQDISNLDGVQFQQAELVAQAFAGDDVVADFEQEKSLIKKEDAPHELDISLPGWGSWTGEGLKKKPSRRFTKHVEGIPVDDRKDAKLKNVIINEKRLKQAKPYMAAGVPYPFENKEQYERSLRVPLGPEWATRTSFQKSIMPRTVIKQGSVIAPMSGR